MTRPLQIKLDEVVRATAKADNSLLDLEELEAEDLETRRKCYLDMAEKARGEISKRKSK